jgi:hypothetical protein
MAYSSILIGAIRRMVAFCDVISRSVGKLSLKMPLFAACLLSRRVTIPRMSIQHQSYLSVIQA